MTFVPVSASTYALDLDEAGKEQTRQEGEKAALRYFEDALHLVTQEQMEPFLRDIHDEMLHHIYRLSGHQQHLRVNVVARGPDKDDEHLHVRYRFNMDFDTDDHLRFEDLCAGGVGRCWSKAEPVTVDLEEVRQTYHEFNMSKYEQALVRPTLKSLLCVPIFDPRDQKEPHLGQPKPRVDSL